MQPFYVDESMTIRPLPILTITLLLLAGCAQQPRVADTNPETAKPQKATPAILIEPRSGRAGGGGRRQSTTSGLRS